MKDATFFFLSEIYRLLTGGIGNGSGYQHQHGQGGSEVQASLSVPVYSIEQTAESTDTLFVRISSAFSRKDNDKDVFKGVYVANIDVVSKVSRQALSYKELTELSNDVTHILYPTTSHNALDSNNEYDVVYARIIDTTDFTDTSDNEYILRRVLTFESRINQK